MQLSDNSQLLSSQRTAHLIRVARDFGDLGWTPATSGNFSIRLDPKIIAMTRSGVHKRRLDSSGMTLVDAAGHPLSGGAPSAETPLHIQIYASDPDVEAVLHVHSPAATVASRQAAANGEIRLSGYELLKALAGIGTHEVEIRIPVVPNHQDMDRLADSVASHLAAGAAGWAYLIQGHGIYAWGHTLEDAARHLEAINFMLESVAAQKLHFSHTARGDVSHWFSGFFDTTSGAKKEADSYRGIARAIGSRPERIVFFSDVAAELDAARSAGMKTLQICRPGNPPAGSHPFRTDFTQLEPSEL